MRLLLMIALLALAGCSWPESNEEENRTIGDSIKLIGNAADKRGCISDEERSGLFALNSILEKRKSGYRIVMWQLPDKACRSG